MLKLLAQGEQSISELAEPFDMSLAGASKHVGVLESAGLVHRTVQGRTHRCRLDAARLVGAHRWIGYYERFWNTHIDKLEALLRAEDEVSGASARKPKRK